jgi:hypothetical protein
MLDAVWVFWRGLDQQRRTIESGVGHAEIG